MSNINKRALRETAEKATKGEWAVWLDDEVYSTNGVENQQIAIAFSKNDMRDAEFIAAANPSTVLALLDELEAAEKKTVEMPTFDGYVPHVARELQAAFRIACDNAGINIAAAGKGE